MGFASSRVRVRFSYIIVVVSFLAAVFSYGFSVWSASRRYDAALPKDTSDSVIRGVLAFHQGAGNFPKDFVEVEEAVWKHKKPPTSARPAGPSTPITIITSTSALARTSSPSTPSPEESGVRRRRRSTTTSRHRGSGSGKGLPSARRTWRSCGPSDRGRKRRCCSALWG